jgi:hypothetical protein
MSSAPIRPSDITEHERQILEKRLLTFDEDLKEARPADEVMREIRQTHLRGCQV